jgi:hypothetical protein
MHQRAIPSALIRTEDVAVDAATGGRVEGLEISGNSIKLTF